VAPPYSIPALLVAIPILFQPELRRALERIGRTGSFLPHAGPNGTETAIDQIAEACRRMSERGWGALLVFERETPLGEFADTGVLLDASCQSKPSWRSSSRTHHCTTVL